MSPTVFFILMVSAMVVKAINHQVYCGGHSASDCGDCPQGNGPTWCNGDCTWVDDQCVARGDTGVVCYDTSKDVCACGQPRCDTKEIIGGRVAKPHEYPTRRQYTCNRGINRSLSEVFKDGNDIDVIPTCISVIPKVLHGYLYHPTNLFISALP